MRMQSRTTNSSALAADRWSTWPLLPSPCKPAILDSHLELQSPNPAQLHSCLHPCKLKGAPLLQTGVRARSSKLSLQLHLHLHLQPLWL